MLAKPKTAVTHNDIQTMSTTMRREFPDADYVMAVKLPTDLAGVPSVTVYAIPTLTPKTTDLSGKTEIPANNGAVIQLMPGKDEILKITFPDASVSYCTNIPRWFWMTAAFTTL
jgi:hypothetical protein